MSNQTRAERRQSGRGGGSSSRPPKRDPMTGIYIGLVALIVIVLAGFGIYEAYDSHRIAAAVATPTPGPLSSSTPVQLVDQTSMGKPTFVPGNTANGGHGDPVDGIPCEASEQVLLHIHSHLSIYNRGTQIQVPPLSGMVANADHRTVRCLYWLHTHDGSGIIHLEAGKFNAPQGGPYTLGMYFDVWGQPLARTQVATFKGAVTAYVNGAVWSGDPRDIPLAAHQLITLEVGTPLVKPVNYVFPIGE